MWSLYGDIRWFQFYPVTSFGQVHNVPTDTTHKDHVVSFFVTEYVLSSYGLYMHIQNTYVMSGKHLTVMSGLLTPLKQMIPDADRMSVSCKVIINDSS